jgi:predicted nucleotidyltransferase
MVSRSAIAQFSNEVARRFKPQRIILFGSYAYGKPTPDSDVDLLVIMPQRRVRRDLSIRMRWAVPRTFPLDLLVRSGQEVSRRLEWGDCFLQEIVAKGRVLYEAAHS